MNVKTLKIHRIKPKYSEVTENKNYSGHKDNLKTDFHSNCGYCGSPDYVFGGRAGFQIDHFAPKSKFPELTNCYSNLIYSCPICNRGKSCKWPSKTANCSTLGNEGFIHPCSKEYDENLYRRCDGSIVASTPVGDYMIQEMKLYLLRHQVIWVREELRALIKEVEEYIDISSELGAKHHELLSAFFRYDELLRVNIDIR